MFFFGIKLYSFCILTGSKAALQATTINRHYFQTSDIQIVVENPFEEKKNFNFK